MVAALRALNAIAESVVLARPDDHLATSCGFLRTLYAPENIVRLSQILSQNAQTTFVQEQISLTASLIIRTCQKDSQRRQLAAGGILDVLAFRLASIILTDGNTDTLDRMPVGVQERLSVLLRAICAAIADSRSRATRFLSSKTFPALFSSSITPDMLWEQHSSQSNDFGRTNDAFNISFQPGFPSAYAPSSHIKHRSWEHTGVGSHFATGPEPPSSNQDNQYHASQESPLIDWLLDLLRLGPGTVKLAAAWLLALLYRSGLALQPRKGVWSMLVVPILVRMLDRDGKSASEHSNESTNGGSGSLENPEWFITENAPRVLALLIAESPELQNAANEAGAIRKIARLLKRSYDPPTEKDRSDSWSPLDDGQMRS